MEKKPRLRAPNFTSSESLLLCDIINKYKQIIENKKTDGANLIQKQKTWVEVENDFNSTTTGYHRTLESLQQNYKNLKKRTKKHASSAKMDIPVDRVTLIENIEQYGTTSDGWKEVAQSTGTSAEVCQNVFSLMKKEAKSQETRLKKNIMCTGGGPPPKLDDDTLLDKVKGLVGPAIDGVYTIYDGDSGLMASQNGLTPIESKNLDELKREEPIRSPDQHTQEPGLSGYFDNDRANLKKPINNLLTTRKRKLESVKNDQVKGTVSEKFKSLAGEKMELVTLQKELILKQIKAEELRLSHLEIQNEMIQKEKTEQEEKLIHNRVMRSMELEEAEKAREHRNLLRKLEIEKLRNI